jgi:hypothetical protein
LVVKISLLEDPLQVEKKKTAEAVPSAGESFPNGSAIELIRDSDGSVKFLIWDGHSAKTADIFTRGNVTHTTPRIHRLIRDSVVLPTGVAKFESTRQLFAEVTEQILRACGGNRSVAEVLSFFAFASWVTESVPVAPFLWVVAPVTFNADALKQVLRLLCRHTLAVNSLSSKFPTSLPMELRPTLIAEVDTPSSGLLNALRASQTRGIYPTRGGGAVDPYCAKVIFAREPLKSLAAAGYPLEIALDPFSQYVPPLDSDRAARIAEKFQGKLLAYRLANLSKVAPPSFDLSQFSAPVQALAHSFAGAIVGDADLQAEILPYLQQFGADIQSDPTVTLNATIVEAVLSRWKENAVSATELAGDVNTLILARGGSRQLSPETIGWGLRRLGLRTVPISHGLHGLQMTEVRPTILKLAGLYGLGTPEQMADRTKAAPEAEVLRF